MSKKWKYHTSYSFTENEKECTIATQLCKIGVYTIFDNDPARQGGMTPSQMAKMDKDIRKHEEDGTITDVVFGRPITVIEDENGFYKEL